MSNVFRKGEFSLLGLSLKIQIIAEFGKLLKTKKEGEMEMKIYKVNNFYVASYFSFKTKLVERVEILNSKALVVFLLNDST